MCSHLCSVHKGEDGERVNRWVEMVQMEALRLHANANANIYCICIRVCTQGQGKGKGWWDEGEVG